MGKLIMAVWFGCILLVGTPMGNASESGEEGGGKEGEVAGPQYIPVGGVLVNLEGRRHYLRAEIQLRVDSAAHGDKIKAHIAPIRHSLIMLLSGHKPEQIAQMQEREKLRQEAKEAIKKVLAENHAGDGFEDVFFTDFLIQ